MDRIQVFKKHRTQARFWDYVSKRYVSQNEIPENALIIDHEGRSITLHKTPIKGNRKGK